MFTSWKMAPALAAGNCVVMKPAELTPLSSLAIAELMAEVGFPAGVVNVLPGLGAVAGQYIAEHPQISKVAFTGSTAVGRKIVQASSGNLKKVQLELGGKGANVVFADANLDEVVQGSAFGIFHNQGQACIAASRLIVHESVADELLERFTSLARSIRIGDPLDPTTEMGPLTSQMHRDRVLSYVNVAREQGGHVISGGKAPGDAALAKGFYVEPTIVAAKPTDRVAQEEVFGPFVTVSTFGSDEEALAIANGTEYGLGAGLWTRDLQRAHLFARQLRSGMVWINCYKRVSPAEVNLGQRRRQDSALLSALKPWTRSSIKACRRAWCSVRAASNTSSARSSCWARSARSCSRRPNSASRPRRLPRGSVRASQACSPRP
jgi:betaine-aldehyde dehydrogenase